MKKSPCGQESGASEKRRDCTYYLKEAAGKESPGTAVGSNFRKEVG